MNKELGLSKTKNSGAVANDGDGKGISKDHSTWVQVLNESKFTEKCKKTVSFKKEDFEKTAASARRLGRIPMMTTYQLGDKNVYVHLTLMDFSIIYTNHLEHTKRER